MAHMKKYKKTAVGAMTNHYDRTETGTKERENIDPSRSHLNYIILGDETKSKDLEVLTDRVRGCVNRAIVSHKETTGKCPRSDAVLFGDWIVTLPKDCEQPDEFFECVVEFMKLRYGADNIPGGFVHDDETTPHMHIPVIPVVGGRLNAKAMLSRKDLRSFHQDLQEYMDDHNIQASILLDEDAIADKLLSSIPQEKLDVFKGAMEKYVEEQVEEQVDEKTAKLEESIEIRKQNLEFEYKRKSDDLKSKYDQRNQELDKREKNVLNCEFKAETAMSNVVSAQIVLDADREELEKNKQTLIRKENDLVWREQKVESNNKDYHDMQAKNTVFGRYATAIVLSVLEGSPASKKNYDIVKEKGVFNLPLSGVLKVVEMANNDKNRTKKRGNLESIKYDYDRQKEKDDAGPDF